MTNEELVFLIQEGHEEHILELWLQVEKYIQMKATDFCNKLSTPHGITPEDLVQVGYFAVLDAVNTCDLDRGFAFLTWLTFHLKRHFYEAAGIRTERDRQDPIESYISLNMPLREDPDCTIADTVPDPVNQYEEVDRSIWLQELHTALDRALDKLPPKESAVIRMRFYDGLTLKEAGKQAGVAPERIRALQQKGMRKLRQTARKNGLEEYIDQHTPYFRNTNFQQSWTSPVENLVIWREGMRQKMTEKGTIVS